MEEDEEIIIPRYLCSHFTIVGLRRATADNVGSSMFYEAVTVIKTAGAIRSADWLMLRKNASVTSLNVIVTTSWRLEMSQHGGHNYRIKQPWTRPTDKGTREGTAGVWSAAVHAVLHGRRNHTPR